MHELVALLKQARQEKNLTLEDMSGRTKIQRRYLEALEGNDFSVFAGEVYLKGALCSYAETVGLDTREVLALYHRLKSGGGGVSEKQVEASRPDSSRPEQSRKKDIPKKIKTGRHGPSLTVGVVVAVLLIMAGGTWLSLYFTRDQNSPDPDLDGVEMKAPGEEDSGLNDAEEEGEDEEELFKEVTVISTSDTETAFAVRGFAEVEIRLTLTGNSWIRLLADDREQFSPRIYNRGAELEYTASENMWIRLGYPKGVRIEVNGFAIEENLASERPHNYLFILE